MKILFVQLNIGGMSFLEMEISLTLNNTGSLHQEIYNTGSLHQEIYKTGSLHQLFAKRKGFLNLHQNLQQQNLQQNVPCSHRFTLFKLYFYYC